MSQLDEQAVARRPLRTRERLWAVALADGLAQRGVSPNAISLASIACAGAAATAILATMHVSGWAWRSAWLSAAVFVQLRLLANMLDGMVALNIQKRSPLGELFNEVPDRVSDAMVLIALGFVSGSSPQLGYISAMLAIFVAYVRAMGASAGAGQVFAGIMAKPQRMFLVTLLCLYQALTPASWGWTWSRLDLGPAGWTLMLIACGCIITAGTRLRTIARRLQGRA